MVVYIGFVGGCQFSPNVCSKQFVLLFYGFCFFFFAFLLIRVISMEGGLFALVLQCGMVLFISIVRFLRKKVQFVLTSCEFGSVSKYSPVSLDISLVLCVRVRARVCRVVCGVCVRYSKRVDVDHMLYSGVNPQALAGVG